MKQVIAQRQVRPFESIADLRHRVRGLGPATMARLAPYLRIVARTEVQANSEVQESVSAPGQARLAQGPRFSDHSR